MRAGLSKRRKGPNLPNEPTVPYSHNWGLGVTFMMGGVARAALHLRTVPPSYPPFQPPRRTPASPPARQPARPPTNQPICPPARPALPGPLAAPPHLQHHAPGRRRRGGQPRQLVQEAQRAVGPAHQVVAVWGGEGVTFMTS